MEKFTQGLELWWDDSFLRNKKWTLIVDTSESEVILEPSVTKRPS